MPKGVASEARQGHFDPAGLILKSKEPKMQNADMAAEMGRSNANTSDRPDNPMEASEKMENPNINKLTPKPSQPPPPPNGYGY
jgi:hypothetical protein